MECDSFPPVAAVPGLVAQMQHGGKNFNLGPTYSTNPYLVFNTVSPNNGGALGKVAVRQAISYAINRAHLIQDFNGALAEPAADPHPARRDQRGAGRADELRPVPVQRGQGQVDAGGGGVPERADPEVPVPASRVGVGRRCSRPCRPTWRKVGIKLTGVGVPDADFYTKYLEVPSVAKRGVWDIVPGRLGPGLVRRRGDFVLQAAVLRRRRPTRRRQQLRVLQQPDGERADRQGLFAG